MSETYRGTIELVFSPGTDRIKEQVIVKNWGEVIDEFYTWIENVVEEVTIEDKWANLDKFISDTGLENSSNVLNDKFSVTEYLEIK